MKQKVKIFFKNFYSKPFMNIFQELEGIMVSFVLQEVVEHQLKCHPDAVCEDVVQPESVHSSSCKLCDKEFHCQSRRAISQHLASDHSPKETGGLTPRRLLIEHATFSCRSCDFYTTDICQWMKHFIRLEGGRTQCSEGISLKR